MKIENVRMLALAALTAKADILTRHTDTDILTVPSLAARPS